MAGGFIIIKRLLWDAYDGTIRTDLVAACASFHFLNGDAAAQKGLWGGLFRVKYLHSQQSISDK